MNLRLIMAVVGLTGCLGTASPLLGADRATSMKAAQRLEEAKDYAGAILVYDQMLKYEPKNRHLLALIVQSHEQGMREDIKQSWMEYGRIHHPEPAVLDTSVFDSVVLENEERPEIAKGFLK